MVPAEKMLLFVLNKSSDRMPEMVKLLGGERKKSLLLIGDGAWHASEGMAGRFKDLQLERIYVSYEAVKAKGVPVDPGCSLVSYDEMIDLIMNEQHSVVNI